MEYLNSTTVYTMKILKIFALILISSICVFADKTQENKLVLIKPSNPKQIFSVRLKPDDPNEKSVKINTNALASRFFFTITSFKTDGSCTGSNAFNFLDIGKLDAKYKKYPVDKKTQTVLIELPDLSKMSVFYMLDSLKLNPDEIEKVTFKLKMRYLTPSTPEDGYSTEKIELNREELKALIKKHYKKRH